MIQLQALNYLLKSKDSSFLLLNNFTEEFFSDYRDEYKYIVDHYTSYGNLPDAETFLSHFPRFDIVEVNESPKFLIDGLYEDRNRRQLAKTFNKIRDLLTEGKVNEAMELYSVSSDNLLAGSQMASVDLIQDTSRYDHYLERVQNIDTFYVSTGLKELDDIIGGWDRREELATIAARTNMGKSWLLIKFALAAAEKGLVVGIYSGEMSEDKVGYRFDTLFSHISNGALTHGDVTVQTDYQAYIENLASSLPGTIKVLTPTMLNGPAGVTSLRAFIEKDHLDMLCVDQHSLLEDDRGARNPVEKAANISRDLKNLQVLKKIPIIAVSQQNRESTDQGLTTSHIAQSDRIAQDSTIIIFFEQKDGILTMYLTKSRDSANGKEIRYAVDLNHGVFTYMPTEDDALEGQECTNLRNEYDGDDVF